MANRTVSIGVKMTDDTGSVKNLTLEINDLRGVLDKTATSAEKLKKSAVNFAALSTGISQAQQAMAGITSAMQELSGAYAVQEQVKTQLMTVMRERMGATEAEIQSVKDLCSAQQALGIIGDEVQLAGVQQMATFLKTKSSIDTLLPAMNNLLAQQKGFNATGSDAVNIGNLIGKAMQGQVSALRRVGITFDEAQERVMKYGTETERAGMLAEIITQNVGEMNKSLANTPSGKMAQVSNALGDVKEVLGGAVSSLMPFITGLNQAMMAGGNIVKIAQAMSAVEKSAVAATARVKGLGTAVKVFGVAARTAFIASGVALAIWGIVEAVNALWPAAKKAEDSLEGLKESEDAFKNAAAGAKVEIEGEIAKLNDLIKSKGDTAAAVNELNTKYGESFGKYKTAQEWLEVLTSKTNDYAKAVGYQAQAQLLASQIAASSIEMEMAMEKKRRMVDEGKDTSLLYSYRPRLTEKFGAGVAFMTFFLGVALRMIFWG